MARSPIREVTSTGSIGSRPATRGTGAGTICSPIGSRSTAERSASRRIAICPGTTIRSISVASSCNRDGDPLELPVIGLSHGRHYRIVEVKFQTVELLKNGDLTTAAGELDTLVQTWIYNEALGRLQGYTPPAAYVAGRGWRTSQGDRGDRCWERLGRIRHDVFLRGRGIELRELVGQAVAWVRRVRTEGAEWRVLPIPSVPELWPNMKAAGRLDRVEIGPLEVLHERELEAIAHIVPDDRRDRRLAGDARSEHASMTCYELVAIALA